MDGWIGFRRSVLKNDNENEISKEFKTIFTGGLVFYSAQRH